MSEIEKPVLTGREIAAALRCCSTNPGEGGGCVNCPMDKKAGRLECSELICLMAADKLGELLDATEEVVKALAERMADLARECNTAQKRGLMKTSGDYVLALNEIQSKLTQLGRASIVQAEPVGEHGWRVTLIRVEGTEVFRSEGGADAEGG